MLCSICCSGTASPTAQCDCGSMSTSRTFCPASASALARLIDMVVLPQPPFWLTIAMVLIVCLRPVTAVLKTSISLEESRFHRCKNTSTPCSVIRQRAEKNFIFLWDGPIKRDSHRVRDNGFSVGAMFACGAGSGAGVMGSWLGQFDRAIGGRARDYMYCICGGRFPDIVGRGVRHGSGSASAQVVRGFFGCRSLCEGGILSGDYLGSAVLFGRAWNMVWYKGG